MWIQHDGKPISLGATTTRHIRNARLYVMAGGGRLGVLARTGCGGFSNWEWLMLFASELRRRSRHGNSTSESELHFTHQRLSALRTAP